jgi:hypothetical protein
MNERDSAHRRCAEVSRALTACSHRLWTTGVIPRSRTRERKGGATGFVHALSPEVSESGRRSKRSQYLSTRDVSEVPAAAEDMPSRPTAVARKVPMSSRRFPSKRGNRDTIAVGTDRQMNADLFYATPEGRLRDVGAEGGSAVRRMIAGSEVLVNH